MKVSGIPPALKTWLPFIVLFVFLALILPRSPKFGYDYRKGSEWKYETLYAQFDFPILKTDEQIREERSKNKASVIPYYRYRQDVVDNARRFVDSADFGEYSSIRPKVISAMEDIFSNGVVSDNGVELSKGDDPSTAVLYFHKDKRVTKRPVSEVYKESDADRTVSHIRELALADRVTEVAVMLSSDPPTPAALQTAKELMS